MEYMPEFTVQILVPLLAVPEKPVDADEEPETSKPETSKPDSSKPDNENEPIINHLRYG